jgi:hypothetical protein
MKCHLCMFEAPDANKLVEHVTTEHCDFDKPPKLPVRKPEKTEPDASIDNPWHGLINNPGPRKYR